MNKGQHLIIDALGQSFIILYFSFFLGQSQSPPLLILQLFVIGLSAWQFVNAVLSYKFFENANKRLFVRVSGFTWGAVFLFWGLIWMLFQSLALSGLATLLEKINDFIESSEQVIGLILPIVLGGLAVWYLYITIRELYNSIYKTI